MPRSHAPSFSRSRGLWGSLLFAVAYLLVESCLQVAPLRQELSLVAPSSQVFQWTIQVDAADQEPATEVQVRVFDERWEPSARQPRYELRATLRGDWGAPLVAEMKSGPVQLLISSPGFATQVLPVRVSSDRQLRVVLQPAGSLHVAIEVEKQGKLVPLAGATVLVGSRGETPRAGLSDARGEIVFSDIVQGPVPVRIYARGYQPYEAVAESDLLVQLRPASILAVLVSANGQPQADARVTIAGPKLWPARTVSTASDGRVEISGLRPGRYSLFAEKGNQVSETFKGATVTAQSGTEEVELSLAPGSFVALSVLDAETDEPLAGARVTHSPMNVGQFSTHYVTDARGHAMIGPLLRREGWLQARAREHVGASLSLDSAEAMKSAPGPLILRLQRAGTVQGRVVDEQGHPIEGASVEVVGFGEQGAPVSISPMSNSVSDIHFDWQKDLRAHNVLIPAGELGVMLGPVPPIALAAVDRPQLRGDRLASDDAGYFRIENVPPGELVVLAQHPDFLDGKSDKLSLSAGASKSTRVVLRGGTPLSGRVLDHWGFPLDGATIRVTGQGFERRVLSSSDGSFELSAAPMRVTVRVSSRDDPLRVLAAHEVEESEREDEVAINLAEPRADVRLTIVDERGEPVALAQLRLSSENASEPLNLTRFTDGSGVVQIPAAEGVKVRAHLRAPGFVQESRELTLVPEAKIALRRAVSAEGRVLAVRGRLPASKAMVEMVSHDGFSVRTRVDEEGGYILRGLPPGRGLLRAVHPEYGKASLSVNVKHGLGDRHFELPDLTLRPALTVSGRVESPSGAAIRRAGIASERLSAYGRASRGAGLLAESDEQGRFVVEVEEVDQFYLYAAAPGRSFGFSDALSPAAGRAMDDVLIVLDHEDAISPHHVASVLVTIERRAGRFLLYAVAAESRAHADGLRAEDELLEIDGQTPETVEHARELLSGSMSSEVRLTVKRGKKTLSVATLREAFQTPG